MLLGKLTDRLSSAGVWVDWRQNVAGPDVHFVQNWGLAFSQKSSAWIARTCTMLRLYIRRAFTAGPILLIIAILFLLKDQSTHVLLFILIFLLLFLASTRSIYIRRQWRQIQCEFALNSRESWKCPFFKNRCVVSQNPGLNFVHWLSMLDFVLLAWLGGCHAKNNITRTRHRLSYN